MAADVTMAEPKHTPVDVRMSSVLRTLEEFVDVLRRDHPELPELVLIVGPGKCGRSVKKWGHFAKNRWHERHCQGPRCAGRRWHEILIAGESFARPAEATAASILHEAAHTLAAVRGLGDTSKKGRYHNEIFRLIAAEVGLEVDRDEYGWRLTRITEAARTRYKASLHKIDRALTVFRAVPKTSGRLHRGR